MSQRFSTSRYLRFVPRENGWAAYHSLFGNLTLIDAQGKQFLEAFKASATIEEASQALPSHSSLTLRSYANHLISQTFLVPTGSDEYSITQQDESMRKERLQSGYLVRAVQLVTINSCNYKCKYCIMNLQAEDRSSSRDVRSAKPMSFEVAETSMRKLMDLLRKNGNDYLNVEFFGGEPLMNWSVIKHVLTTFGNNPDSYVKILYSITTNGTLITREIAELFKTYNVTVTISVDIPTRISGTGLVMAKSADAIQRSLEILKQCGNAITFNSVISKETIQYFDGHRLVDLAREYNVVAVGLILDLDLPFYRNNENRERVLKILLDTDRYAREVGVRVVGYWHQIFDQIIGKQEINLRSGYKTCPATGVKVSVEPEGTMYTCKCTSNSIGHIQDLDQVLSSDGYADYAMQAYRHAPECEGCEIEGFCSGVCMGSFENDYKRKDMIETGACEMFRRITRDLIADLPTEEASRLFLEENSLF